MRQPNHVMTVAAVLLVASLASGNAQAQQDYPTKSMRLIVPFAPGGGTDIVARLLAQKVSEGFRQTVIVDNRAGGGGTIGAETAVRATPDGYTVIMMSGSYATNAAMFKLPYDPVNDILPMGLVGDTAFLIALHPAVPIKSVGELIAFLKAKPGALNYGSSGTGGIAHLSGELFDLLAATKMTHVPYKGNTPAMTALMSGEVALVFDPVLTSMPMVKSGRVRALAVTTARRSALLPDVPTVAEAGVKGYEAGNWFGIFAPAGTPREIVARVNEAINKAMTRPEMKDKLASQGADALTGSPADLAALVQRELAKFAGIIKAAGVRVE